MGLDLFDLLFWVAIGCIYVAAFIISAIFTFSIETYHRIEEILRLEIVASPVITPLELNICNIDTWLNKRNRAVGVFLMIFSIADLIFLVNAFRFFIVLS